jgi:hypothetical protein
MKNNYERGQMLQNKFCISKTAARYFKEILIRATVYFCLKVFSGEK